MQAIADRDEHRVLDQGQGRGGKEDVRRASEDARRRDHEEDPRLPRELQEADQGRGGFARRGGQVVLRETLADIIGAIKAAEARFKQLVSEMKDLIETQVLELVASIRRTVKTSIQRFKDLGAAFEQKTNALVNDIPQRLINWSRSRVWRSSVKSRSRRGSPMRRRTTSSSRRGRRSRESRKRRTASSAGFKGISAPCRAPSR